MEDRHVNASGYEGKVKALPEEETSECCGCEQLFERRYDYSMCDICGNGRCYTCSVDGAQYKCAHERRCEHCGKPICEWGSLACCEIKN